MYLHMLEKFRIEIFKNGQYLTLARQYDHMRTNLEKFRYGEHLIKQHKRIFKWESGIKVHNKKSYETSISLRVEGNNLHNQGEYAKAVICYNKSLCFAASSENIAIGYSNRSASLFEMGRFKDCKENIRLARELNALPENLKKKLDNRMLKCGNEDQGCFENNNASNELNLTYRNHASVPFIVDRLEIKQERGKSWIYAKEYIEPSTVIIKEDIFNFSLLPAGYFTHCHFCIKMSGDLIPCPGCTTTMFCNEDCMNRANEEFHKWECPIIDLLNSFDESLKFSFRIFLQMLHVYGDYDKLEKYWKELHQNNVSWFSIGRAKLTQTEQMRIFHSSEKLEFPNSLTIALASVGVAFFKTEIMKHSDLKRIFKTKEQSDLFGAIILHHVLLLEKRRNLIVSVGGESFNFNIGYASGCTLIKEIKSTVTPNVKRQKWDGKQIIWSACRPIKKGECLQKDISPLPEDELNVLGMEMFLGALANMSQSHYMHSPPHNFRF